jgi:hypothetical protein
MMYKTLVRKQKMLPGQMPEIHLLRPLVKTQALRGRC